MYENDSLDILGLGTLPPTEIDRARQRHAGEYVPVPELITRYVGFDVRRPPFDDRRVRRAFVLATDRETLADMVMRGYHFPATGGFIPPGMPGHSPGIGLPYDPERARQLLAEAGYPGGRGFPVVDALTGRGHIPLMEYLQPQWEENLGVEIPWEPMEWATFDDRMRRKPPHIFITGWAADYPDPDDFLRMCHFRLFTGWRNDAYDRLVDEARRITEQRKRMKLYGQADRILVEEAPIILLIYARRHLLVKSWVTKYPTSAISWFVWKDVVIEPH
jgi:oligopeptide transport system substrate-binding protein